jgi:D-serine deaminase-like pyridoxal phosphate-dependent protein
VRELQAAAQRAGATVETYIELEVGMRRCGVAPGEPALALVKAIAACPNLRFAGIHAYHGRAQHIRSAEERRTVIQNSSLLVRNTRALLEKNQIVCPIVTGAGSGTFMFEVELGVWDEIQPGSYVFMDRDYARNEWATTADDVLWRRTKLGLHLDPEARARVAAWFGEDAPMSETGYAAPTHRFAVAVESL